MDAQVKETLTGGGIDVDGMLERCMGSEAIMGRLLKKFPTDATYARLEEAFASGDAKAALEASHTLKGVCGNLSITAMHEMLDRQVHALRDGDMKGAESMMSEISLAYASAVRAIEQGLG